jgi:hypothetical protein
MRLRFLFLTAMFLGVTLLHAQTAAAEQPVNNEVMKSETISVDYDEANAIITAFEAKNAGWRGGAKYLATTQVAGKGKVNHQVFEWHPNRVVHNRELWPKIEAQPGYKFADVLTAMKYALDLPDRQMQYPVAILFEQNSRPYCLYLDRLEGRPQVDVFRLSLDLGYRKSFRFLLVHE